MSNVCLCVRNSYLEILPSGTFFQEKNNPRRTTSHNLQNGQFCCCTRAPPSASFGNISAKNQATKPALKPNWATGFDAYCCRAPSPISPVRISTGIPYTGLCSFYRTIIITEVDDDGMITLLHNHPDSGRRCRGSRRGIGGVGRHSDREEWPQFDRHNLGVTQQSSTALIASRMAAVAQRRKQNQRHDNEGSSGATIKREAAAAR